MESATVFGETAEQTVIDGYRVLRTIGQGSQGVVYLVEHPARPGSKYAMKVFEADMEFVELARFEKEGEVAGMIHHPNVVALLGSGEVEATGDPYLVYEYVDGHSLRAYLNGRGNLTYRQKALIVRDVAEALRALHAIAVVHRDVKPENILLDSQLRPKLTDFGMVRTPDSNLTCVDAVIGSPAYMSPETIQGYEPQPSCDLFALGLTAYELFTGGHPFREHAATPFTMMDALAERPHLPPSAEDPFFPRALETVVDGMLAKSASDRVPSAAVVVDLIDQYLESIPD